MKQIQITPAELRTQAAELNSLRAEYESLFSNLNSVLNRTNDAWSENLSHNFVGKISSTQKSCSSILEALQWGSTAATKSAESFETVDNTLANGLNGNAEGTTGTSGGTTTEVGTKKGSFKDVWNQIWGDGLTGAVVGGAGVAAGKLLGINTSGTAKGDLIGGSVKGKTSAKWDTKKGEISATGQVDANGHLAEGELSGNIGYLNGSVKAGIGVAAATGSVGATLFKNGKLSPKLQAKAEGSVSAASGEAKVSVGTDENNIHAKASGDLGKAKAEASVGVGMVSTKNADGEEKTAFGAEGKFEVGAYAAEGKISGGLTIFGIKVDASIKGKAGGVGAEVGGSVTTNGVSGTIGAAFGLGGGVEISVDWSEFSLFGKKKK